MTSFQYKRAPITEAVVEIRFDNSGDDKKRKKALQQFGKAYSKSNVVTQQTIEVKPQPLGEPITKATDTTADKYTSHDMTEQLVVSDHSILESQLAPYPGWNQFEQRIRRDWKIWRKATGFRAVSRVGMRYINRLDLPITDDVVRHEDYVTVYPALPDLIDTILSHSVNVRVNLADIQSSLNLSTAMVSSPIPDHLSIVLDLDIVRIFESPPEDEELFSFISQARAKKNELFEACITDKSRELFK